MTQYLGWAATAVFIASYFFTRPIVLRAVQMAGALMWVTYGGADRRPSGGGGERAGVRCGRMDRFSRPLQRAGLGGMSAKATG